MLGRVLRLGTGVVGLALAAMLVMGLAAPAFVFAAHKHHPRPPSWVLVVEHNGTAVRVYTLSQLEALSPFVGYAGFMKVTGAVVGPDAMIGVQITDIVQDALGTPLTTAESVVVADADPADPYAMTFSYDQLVNLTGFTMYDATSKNPVNISSLLGPLGAVLMYDDPLQRVMPPESGPLRFIIADATPENAVMQGSVSVYHLNQLNVLDPGVGTQIAQASARS